MAQLSSDILEAQFGPTSVKVLYQDGNIRVIQTIANDTGKILEWSLVRFVPEGIGAFPDIHAAIRAGQSMGKAFRENGVAFARQELFARKHDAATAIQKLFQTNQATVVGVTVLVGPSKIPYATITETYSGDATWPNLFGELTKQAEDDLATLASGSWQ